MYVLFLGSNVIHYYDIGGRTFCGIWLDVGDDWRIYQSRKPKGVTLCKRCQVANN